MKHLRTIVSMLVLLAVCACTKNNVTENGQVVFTLSDDQSVVDKTKSNVSDYTALPSKADFVLVVTDAGSANVWSGKLSEWNGEAQLAAGNYTVTASYGSIEEEGFDKPFFEGSANFAVQGGQQTAVSIPVKLANTVVKLSFTQNFTNYYKDYTFKLTRDGNEIVTFVKGETKAAFVDGYKFTLEGTLVDELGRTKTFSKEYTNLETATAYTIGFDASNVGGVSIIIIEFDDTLETVQLGDYELND